MVDVTEGTGRYAAGIGFSLLAFALFSTMDTLVKWLSGGYSLIQIVFFLNLLSLLPLGVVAARSGPKRAFATRRPILQTVRALISMATALCYFFAFSRMPLADAYAIAFASPLIITALSVPFLGERVGWRRWAAVAVGFAGILVMLRPGGGMIHIGALGAIGGALCYSTSMLIVRRMGGGESAITTALWGTLVGLAVPVVLLPFAEFQTPDIADLALLLATGVVNGLAVICLVQAFRLAPASVAAPFQYSQMLWALAFGYLVFGDRPDAWMLAGAAVVVASGLYVLLGEGRKTSAPA